jgi:hypothetical protein
MFLYLDELFSVIQTTEKSYIFNMEYQVFVHGRGIKILVFKYIIIKVRRFITACSKICSTLCIRLKY